MRGYGLAQKLKNFPIDDPIKHRQAALLQVMLMGFLITMLLALGVNLLTFGVAALIPPDSLPNLTVLLATLAAFVLLRRGRLNGSVWLIVGVILLILAAQIFIAGLANNETSLMIFLIPVTVAGFILGRPGLILAIAASIVIVVGAAIWEQAEPSFLNITRPQGGEVSAAVIVFVFVIGLFGLMLDQFSRAFQQNLAIVLLREEELKQTLALLEARSTELARINRELGEEVTHRQQAEEGIRQLNLELEQRVAERTAQLEASNKELEAFSSSVSHDLRAPLRHIDGFVQALRKREAGRLDPTSARYMDFIAESAVKMNQLIDDLLAFSRTARVELRTQRVDLNGLIREVQQELIALLQNRTVIWEIGNLPPVEADPSMLKIVWTNLLSNAIKYTSRRPEAHIRIDMANRPDLKQNDRVVLFIQDDGVGFDPQYVDKLFGVFQRLHTQDEFEGVGIGLATVQRIIHRHGGQVWAEGELDRGATFYITLKRA